MLARPVRKTASVSGQRWRRRRTPPGLLSADEFQAHYGDVLDRLGDERGRHLSLPETTFEDRGLPPGSLNDLLTCGSPANCHPTQ